MTAFLTVYTNIRYKTLIEGLVFLPFVIPAYVMTISWTGLTAAGGALTQLLQAAGLPPLDLYTRGGIIAMLGICHMSVVHVTVSHRLKKISEEVDWAARVSGCPPWKTIRRVDLPMAAPAIASGTVLAFLADVDNFAVPAFLGISSNIPVLSTYIYEKVISFGPDSFAYGAVLSVVLSVIALTGTLLAARLGGRRDGGEGGRAHSEARIVFFAGCPLRGGASHRGRAHFLQRGALLLHGDQRPAEDLQFLPPSGGYDAGQLPLRLHQ